MTPQILRLVSAFSGAAVLFSQRVNKYLHVALAMSPAGNKFRQRCRLNPSLVNCCTVDWYDEWSREACLSVARVYFASTEFPVDKDISVQVISCDEVQRGHKRKESYKSGCRTLQQRAESFFDAKQSSATVKFKCWLRFVLQELQEKVAEMCVDMHDMVKQKVQQLWEETRYHCYVTPACYMELIRTYTRLLREQTENCVQKRNRLHIGASELASAKSAVATMQEELVRLGPRIEKKTKVWENCFRLNEFVSSVLMLSCARPRCESKQK